jgi:uncharacterized membrane protein SpoIIM required for sporulation
MAISPRQFEERYAPVWAELERGLVALESGRAAKRRKAAAAKDAAGPAPGGARIAQLYRQCCEHMALARERAYPVHLVARLEALTARAHQHIYRRHDYGLAALGDLVRFDIPAAVRALRWHVLVAFIAFAGPLIAMGIATWHDPHFVLTVASVQEARSFDRMYGPEAAEHLGRTSGDDWHMFGFYILNNIGIAFQCFATGLALGLGSLFMLGFNGLKSGAVAGYLVARGDAGRFFSFVVTHGAFELTAIVLAGAAGLRLGHALLAPGRHGRVDALRRAAVQTAPVMYGVFAMLLTAAAFEAFWSSAGWIAPGVKYGVGGACWAVVLAYLTLQGRGRPAAPAGDAR